jgi:hypothetical protein
MIKMKNTFIIILFFSITNCFCQTKNTIMITDSAKELSNKLFDETYSLLFLSSSDTVDALWKNYESKLFIDLLIDPKADDNVRFLAAEILFHKLDSFPPKDLYNVLAQVYALALKNTGTSNKRFLLAANGWGFLYDMNHVGFLGKRFILLGESAIKYLIGLLDNDDHVLYEGSREATTGNAYNYRIKDIAAF